MESFELKVYLTLFTCVTVCTSLRLYFLKLFRLLHSFIFIFIFPPKKKKKNKDFIMSSHVVVLDSSARRATVKTSPSKHLADILQEACSKLGLDASQSGLK